MGWAMWSVLANGRSNEVERKHGNVEMWECGYVGIWEWSGLQELLCKLSLLHWPVGGWKSIRILEVLWYSRTFRSKAARFLDACMRSPHWETFSMLVTEKPALCALEITNSNLPFPFLPFLRHNANIFQTASTFTMCQTLLEVLDIHLSTFNSVYNPVSQEFFCK